MITQQIHLYEKPAAKVHYYQSTYQPPDEAIVLMEIELANKSNIKVGNKYVTKFDFEIEVTKLGKGLREYFMTKGMPSVVQCKQYSKETKNTWDTQYTVSEILEMKAL